KAVPAALALASRSWRLRRCRSPVDAALPVMFATVEASKHTTRPAAQQAPPAAPWPAWSDCQPRRPGSGQLPGGPRFVLLLGIGRGVVSGRSGTGRVRPVDVGVAGRGMVLLDVALREGVQARRGSRIDV